MINKFSITTINSNARESKKVIHPVRSRAIPMVKTGPEGEADLRLISFLDKEASSTPNGVNRTSGVIEVKSPKNGAFD